MSDINQEKLEEIVNNELEQNDETIKKIDVDNEINKLANMEENDEEFNEDDLLEEISDDEDYNDEEKEKDVDLSEFFNKSSEDYVPDSFKIEDYLHDNFSFKEIDNKTFDEYKFEQLGNPQVKEIEVMYEKGFKLKNLDTFDDFIRFKKENGYVYTITIGLPYEYELFGLEPKIYICKAFNSKDLDMMLSENPAGDQDLEFFQNYIISSCVLFPEIRMEDVPKLEIGIVNVLLPAILKHSRYNTNYSITRL